MERAATAAKHARVIELRVAGWTQEAIAAELGYADKSGVRYVLDEIAVVIDQKDSHTATMAS
jgi:transcriptional regulator